MEQIKDWNELRDKAHKNAILHGFYEDNPSQEHWLCLIVSELMESVESHRKGKRVIPELLAHFKHPEDYTPGGVGFDGYFKMYIKDTVEDELADAVIRILDLAGAYDINMNAKNRNLPMFPEEGSTYTENIYLITQELVSGNKPLAVSLNNCRMQICKLAEYMGINISWHIRNKMKYNENRPYRHGKNY